MKTTFKKTLAAISAAAVVAASAAVMAVPTSAAGGTLSITSATMTLSELKAAEDTVTLYVSCTADMNSCGLGWALGDGVTYVKSSGTVAEGGSGLGVYNESINRGYMPWAYATVPLTALEAGTNFASITVTVPEEAGTYTVTVDGNNADGDAIEITNSVTGEAGTATGSTGTITITEDAVETTAAPTTEAPAESTTAAATTAVATATKKTTTSTASPKTGDALPVAGVAVAVAVIGGVALVAKKRK